MQANTNRTAPTQLLWFKRDLRVLDHPALHQAMRLGPVLAVYVYEPEVLHAPDYSAQHLGFTNECLQELHTALASLGIRLLMRHGEVCEVLQDLHERTGFARLWSHEETGNGITYTRDIAVGRWCAQRGVRWHQAPNNGVVRRLKNRDHWTRLWIERMTPAPLSVPQPQTLPSATQQQHAQLQSCGLMDADSLGVLGSDKPMRQRGGHAAAQALLESFLDSRASDYRQGMSSPLTAQDSCSRLSPFIAYGVVSVRMVVHALHDARAYWLGIPAHERPLGMLQSLKSFESRLHWHCHFIQKLESQPDIEYHNLHRAYNGLRPEPDPRRLAAWCEGRTGVPMVDACMRMLLATGWINFRMRAMLMSFSSYHLWQHWREPALHLAREFLDYEPGIHYPQVQMQSGTTGINTIRIYSPTKQALDQDPEGQFIRQWCPELRNVPTAYLAEPWTMPLTLQQHLGCVLGVHYPQAVVDVAAAGKAARDTMWGLRDTQKKSPAARAHTQDILQTHASRDPGRETRRKIRPETARTSPSPKAAAKRSIVKQCQDAQADLFGDLPSQEPSHG